uniref:heat stress transcription factor A-2b-like n=1 Tax=Erigeron canadensis TaxID=72917 RepID=UPI001CB90DE1|nr:heat stress transcription factor A-2b-like [Erigeron canadensis]
MNPLFSVVKEEEYQSAGSSANDGGSRSSGKQTAVVQPPQPMEGLNDSGPPPFLTKVYDMVDDESIDHILSWTKEGQSFVVWDPHAFSTSLLPRYFKHNNFSSFIRQLNTYGFRKIDPDIWEFANESFLKGQRHVLKNIKRRKASAHPPPQQQAQNPCVEVGGFGVGGEVERLQRDKHILMAELVKLRQQHQNTRAQLQEMELRLEGSEMKQQKMMCFLAKALQNPEFVQKLARHGKTKELEGMIKKRSRPAIDQGLSYRNDEELRNLVGFQVSELEELALEMQGIGRSKRNQEDEVKEVFESYGGDKEFDEEFLEELFDGQFYITGSEGGEADRMDFLTSSGK